MAGNTDPIWHVSSHSSVSGLHYQLANCSAAFKYFTSATAYGVESFATLFCVLAILENILLYHWVCQWKSFENRLTFGEVIGKSLMSCFWLAVQYGFVWLASIRRGLSDVPSVGVCMLSKHCWKNVSQDHFERHLLQQNHVWQQGYCSGRPKSVPQRNVNETWKSEVQTCNKMVSLPFADSPLPVILIQSNATAIFLWAWAVHLLQCLVTIRIASSRVTKFSANFGSVGAECHLCYAGPKSCTFFKLPCLYSQKLQGRFFILNGFISMVIWTCATFGVTCIILYCVSSCFLLNYL